MGLNTTALIEAAILEKPVLSFGAADRAKLRKTLPFSHLERGLVRLAPDLPAHVDQLADALSGRTSSERSRSFIREFVRPLGVDVPAGVRLAEALEDVVAQSAQHQTC